MRSALPIVLLLTLSLAACGSSHMPGEGDGGLDGGTPAPTPIRVGVISSLSGALSFLGPGWVHAAELAAEEVNAAGGPLPGSALELIVADDATDAATGEREARRLIEEEGVVAILGAPASSITLPIAELTAAARIPQLSCCSTSDALRGLNQSLAERDRFLFRVAPNDALQGAALVDLAQARGCAEVAVLHLEDAYGSPMREAIDARAAEVGLPITGSFAFEAGAASYLSTLRAADEGLPGCLALITYPQSGGTIVREWEAEIGRPVTWIGTDALRTSAFVEEAGGPALLGSFYGVAPVLEPDTAAFSSFRVRYETRFRETPTIFAGHQYDALQLLSLAIASAGSADGEAVRDALLRVARAPGRSVQRSEGLAAAREGEELDYEGVSGALDFDPLHGVSASIERWHIDGRSGALLTDEVLPAP